MTAAVITAALFFCYITPFKNAAKDSLPCPDNTNKFILFWVKYYIIICHITCRGDTCYHVCATWVPQIIGAVPGIQHGESRVTTDGQYSPNMAMSCIPKNKRMVSSKENYLEYANHLLIVEFHK